MSNYAVSPDTFERYQAVYDRLDNIGRRAGLPTSEEEAPFGFAVDAFLSERINWTPGTERSKKAAVLRVLGTAINEGSIPAYCARRRLLGLIAPEVDEHASHFSSQEERDAAIARARKFERERAIRMAQKAQLAPYARAAYLNALLSALKGSRNKWKADTICWYKAALLTGIAPMAWKCATWVDCGRDRFAICVSESGNPERIAALHALDRFTAGHLAVIRAHVDTVAVKVRVGEFEIWYHACRTLLRVEASSCWPGQEQRPTLHPKRHLLAKTADKRLTEQELSVLD